MVDEKVTTIVDTTIKFAHDLGYAKGYIKGFGKGIGATIMIAGTGKVIYEYYKKKRKDNEEI